MSDPCKFVGIEGEKCDRLHELLSRKTSRTTRKRAPSVYNLYIKECIKTKGGIKKFGEAAPIMRQCAGEYKEDKKKGAFSINLKFLWFRGVVNNQFFGREGICRKNGETYMVRSLGFARDE